MLRAEQVEELMSLVSALDRETLIRQFQCYQASFPLDFSADFLRTSSLERLRHIFVAVCLQTQHMPEITHAA